MTLPWTEGNLRSLGLADMAAAIRADRPHRASGELALHVLEVMEAFAPLGRERALRRDRHPLRTARGRWPRTARWAEGGETPCARR